jgi:FKBP-type peptidyl-prolyl cis-trans isomerase SlyD
MSVSIVSDGLVVGINYVLRDGEGEILDQSGGNPLAYLHGGNNIVPGLESQLVGKSVGDKVNAVVSPTEGYGEANEGRLQVLPREAFGDMELGPGMQLATRDPETGGVIPFWISEVGPDGVTIDFNHPLAGVTLHFDVEIMLIREATDDERAHGHPHGLDGQAGHHH